MHFAALKFAADFCSATIEINGERPCCVAIRFRPRTNWKSRDISVACANELCVTTRDGRGPAAIALSLTILIRKIVASRLSRTVVGRQVAGPPRQRWTLVRATRDWGLGRCAVTISPLENYEQWQQTKRDAPVRQPQTFGPAGLSRSRRSVSPA